MLPDKCSRVSMLYMRHLTLASDNDTTAFAVLHSPKFPREHTRREASVIRAIFMMSAPPQNTGKVLAPLRILCLHGFMQNAAILRRKTGALRKALRRGGTDMSANLYFLDAPFILNKTTPPAKQSSEPRSKRDTGKSDTFDIVHSPGHLIYPEHSLNSSTSDRPQIVNRTWWHAEGAGRSYTGWNRSLDLLLSTISELVSFYVLH